MGCPTFPLETEPLEEQHSKSSGKTNETPHLHQKKTNLMDALFAGMSRNDKKNQSAHLESWVKQQPTYRRDQISKCPLASTGARGMQASPMHTHAM